MSLNSFVTPDGAEIGRAQAMQAAAAGIEPDARMNPVLLKPGSDTRTHVIVLGQPSRRGRRRRVPPHSPGPARDRPGQPGQPAGRLRRGHLRGRGQPGGDQPAGHRHRQHGAGPGGWAAGRRGRRHRPGRRVRGPVRHPGLARTSGPGPGRGFIINKFRGDPGILLAPGWTGCHGPDRAARAPASCPGCRGLGLDMEDSLALDSAAWAAAGPVPLGRRSSGSASSAPRGSATSPTWTRWPRAGRAGALRDAPGRAGRRRPRGAARNPGHRGRPGVAAGAAGSPRRSPSGPGAGRPGTRHLRRLPDARRGDHRWGGK